MSYDKCWNAEGSEGWKINKISAMFFFSKGSTSQKTYRQFSPKVEASCIRDSVAESNIFVNASKLGRNDERGHGASSSGLEPVKAWTSFPRRSDHTESYGSHNLAEGRFDWD